MTKFLLYCVKACPAANPPFHIHINKWAAESIFSPLSLYWVFHTEKTGAATTHTPLFNMYQCQPVSNGRNDWILTSIFFQPSSPLAIMPDQDWWLQYQSRQFVCFFYRLHFSNSLRFPFPPPKKKGAENCDDYWDTYMSPVAVSSGHQTTKVRFTNALTRFILA